MSLHDKRYRSEEISPANYCPPNMNTIFVAKKLKTLNCQLPEYEDQKQSKIERLALQEMDEIFNCRQKI